jgi:hypothetical protein
MHKNRDKEVAGKDPNGRFSGRGLIMWHRKSYLIFTAFARRV